MDSTVWIPLLQKGLSILSIITNYVIIHVWDILQTVVGVRAVIKAVEIARAQIALSEEQGKIIDRQTSILEEQKTLLKGQTELTSKLHEFMVYDYNVSSAQYIMNKNIEIINFNYYKSILATITKYSDKDQNIVNEMIGKLEEYKKANTHLNSELDKNLKVYNKRIKEVPDGSEWVENPD